MDSTISQIIKDQFTKYVITESLARIEKCLAHLSLEELWHKQNENTNAIGNLILHLEGNMRQYIVAGVGGQEDTRNRPVEFSQTERWPASKLVEHIAKTLMQADKVVQNLSENDLERKVIIQGFEHTVLSAIIHVIEHLSYHVGQITYYTKFVKDIDTAYYGGQDLDVNN